MRRSIVPWLFVLPILLLHGLVIVGPSISGMYYSLTKWSGIGPAEFIGLENFRRLIFDDMDFRRAFLNNLIWLAIFLTIPIALALVAASLLAPIRRGGMLFRALLFIPYIVPSVVTASIWRNLLHPTLGIGGQLAEAGVRGLDIAYLGNARTALYAVALADNWHWWGFLMVLFLAAMQNIPPDLYEAARIDGANRWDEFRHITIPGIRPTLVFMILMTAIWSFLVFDYIWILTQGGPAGSSEVLGTLLYKNAFNRFDAGYASAMGLTMSFFAGIIICIFIVLRRRGWEI
ncbi:MAG TPA: sugar ABC transporter permease [Roseiflexaceae bacterium]|nr:sugar ABC transporter permease [Roseiflexaceae bacterium]